MRGIASYANERGNWHVFSAPEGEEYAVLATGGYRWDGLIIRPAGAGFTRRVLQLGVPVVSLGSLRIHASIPRVKVDDAQNTALILRHLMSGGLKRFAYCSFYPTLRVEDRGAAFVAHVRSAGHECFCFNRFCRVTEKDPWQYRLRKLMAWLKQLPKPIGIATYSPDVACQVVDACNRIGVAIPDDVAVIAADDDPMKCELSRPTVSAVEIPASRIGYEACSLLDRMIGGKAVSRLCVQVPAAGVIAIRQSSAIVSPADREVRAAAETIRRSATQGMSVAQLAEQMQVSPRWLQRHFKRAMGCTPRERMQATRLEQAKRLLLETDWPAVRIAQKSGFCSASHLNRCIRDATGLTPVAFRHKFRL